MTEYVIDPKKPLPRPEWVEKTNAEGRMWAAAGMLSHVVPLDEASILASAYQMTGLNDMGRKAQESIMLIPDRLRRLADLVETRSRAKTFSFDVAFNREFSLP